MVSGEIGVGHVGCAWCGWQAVRRRPPPLRTARPCGPTDELCARNGRTDRRTVDGTGGGEAPFLSRDRRTLGGRKRRPPRPLGDAEHMRARPRPATPTCPTATSPAPPHPPLHSKPIARALCTPAADVNTGPRHSRSVVQFSIRLVVCCARSSVAIFARVGKIIIIIKTRARLRDSVFFAC